MHETGAPPRPEGNNEMDDGKHRNRPRVYNTHLIIDSFGSLVNFYRKVHLFDVSIPSEGINLRESATTAPGSKLVVCDSPLGKLGLSTCYDVRFPEMYTELSGIGGAEILLVPSAFTVPTGKYHWHTLLKARAIENQCYVIASAQYGRHNSKRQSYGHSMVVDPYGEVLADAGGHGSRPDRPEEKSKIIFCDISEEKIRLVRERMPLRSHRENLFSW